MGNHKCRECDKIFTDNPRRCDECGNSILTPTKEQPVEEKIEDSDLTEEQLKGKNVAEENKTLSQKFKDLFK